MGKREKLDTVLKILIIIIQHLICVLHACSVHFCHFYTSLFPFIIAIVEGHGAPCVWSLHVHLVLRGFLLRNLVSSTSPKTLVVG